MPIEQAGAGRTRHSSQGWISGFGAGARLELRVEKNLALERAGAGVIATAVRSHWGGKRVALVNGCGVQGSCLSDAQERCAGELCLHQVHGADQA